MVYLRLLRPKEPPRSNSAEWNLARLLEGQIDFRGHHIKLRHTRLNDWVRNNHLNRSLTIVMVRLLNKAGFLQRHITISSAQDSERTFQRCLKPPDQPPMTGRLRGSLEKLAVFIPRMIFTRDRRLVDLCVLFYTSIANLASATIETSEHCSQMICILGNRFCSPIGPDGAPCRYPSPVLCVFLSCSFIRLWIALKR